MEQLHRNARGEEIVQKAIQRAEEEFARQHTFQPKVIKSTVRACERVCVHEQQQQLPYNVHSVTGSQCVTNSQAITTSWHPPPHQVQPRSAQQVDLSNPATLTRAIAENDRIREERLERKRREIAEKEIAPCTFQPDIPDLPRAYQPTAKVCLFWGFPFRSLCIAVRAFKLLVCGLVSPPTADTPTALEE